MDQTVLVARGLHSKQQDVPSCCQVLPLKKAGLKEWHDATSLGCLLLLIGVCLLFNCVATAGTF
jgi:hypothetical protein